jgi:4-amino-4-deoxy-L-arabinose transferase-like glycosyltransferase
MAAAVWLVLLGVALATRPLLPVDETRYLSVAWEMWQRGDFLVPHLNGSPYSDKPPLLFWLIHAGWWAFGVSETWPRLVPPLFALANLGLTAAIARRLWPGREEIARWAPLVLVSSLLWAVFTTLVMFDMLLTSFTLLGILGVLLAWRGAVAGWLLVALALGLGVLSKGPVILLHVLPVALLAPWWMTAHAPARWWRWYGALALAVLLGAAIALAWAVPAARVGGPRYAHDIFFGQTAGRVANAFAHRRPLWWYVPILPLVLLPWVAWPAAWRALDAIRRGAGDTGTRCCAAWLAVVFLALSLISGKQMHYLLPLFPAAALLLGRALADTSLHVPVVERALTALAGAATVLLVAAHVGFARYVAPAYDVGPIARYLHALERGGHPIAHVGRYHAQFQFAGRLERPLEVIDQADVARWRAEHPGGVVVSTSRTALPPASLYRRRLSRPYGLGVVVVTGRR